MENLNKENFWNALKLKYPEAVDNFCKWIDEYKKREDIDWYYLFGNDKRDSMEHIKFHDIPLEMQIGILLLYVKEFYSLSGDKFTFTFENFPKELELVFGAIQWVIVNSPNHPNHPKAEP
jgi:hypothetical protein